MNKPEYTLKLSREAISLIFLAMQDMPFKSAYPVIVDIQKQISVEDARPEKGRR